MIRGVIRTIAALILLGLIATTAALSAQAEAPPAPPTEAEARLAGAVSLKCTFPVSARTAWKAGVPEPVLRRTGSLTVEIREMKADQGSAVLATGRTGKDLTMVVDQRNRQFLDAGGNRIALTTVLGEFSEGTKLKATHSVLAYVALELASFKSEPEVQQYWGDCETTP